MGLVENVVSRNISIFVYIITLYDVIEEVSLTEYSITWMTLRDMRPYKYMIVNDIENL